MREGENLKPEVSTSGHRLVFLISSGMLLIAVMLGQVHRVVPSASISRLPVLCAFRRITGIPCPGCGLTRSWVALGEGSFHQSLVFHRLGWLVMLYVFTQALRHGLWLLVPGLRTGMDRLGKHLDWGILVLAGALFINWFFTLRGLL